MLAYINTTPLRAVHIHIIIIPTIAGKALKYMRHLTSNYLSIVTSAQSLHDKMTISNNGSNKKRRETR